MMNLLILGLSTTLKLSEMDRRHERRQTTCKCVNLKFDKHPTQQYSHYLKKKKTRIRRQTNPRKRGSVQNLKGNAIRFGGLDFFFEGRDQAGQPQSVLSRAAHGSIWIGFLSNPTQPNKVWVLCWQSKPNPKCK